MNIHEYQAKEFLDSFGVNTLPGGVAETPGKAVDVAKTFDCPRYVVKAQIHAGGRGKGGGVKLANSIAEVKQHAEDILGMQLVTPQTGPEGKFVRKVLIVQAVEIQKEFYLAILLDRETSQITLIGSEEGGVNIEEVAARTPRKDYQSTDSSCLWINRVSSTKFRYQIDHQPELSSTYSKCY